MQASGRWSDGPAGLPLSRARATDSGELLLRLLDLARAKLLRLARPWSGRLAADRDLRVAWTGVAIVSCAFVASALFPLWVLALGPIFFGVPHLVADLRYAGIRSGLLTRRATLLACGLPLLVLAFWGGLALGFGAVAAAFALSPGRPRVRVFGVVVALVGLAVALAFPLRTTVVMAHLHNFIAVGLWWAWRPRRAIHAWTLVLLALCSFALLSGVLDLYVTQLSGPGARELSLGAHAASLTQSFSVEAGSPWPARWVLLFAFAQSVHYGVWLHLVRDDDRERATPRTFVRSYRVARAELGAPLLIGALLLSLALAIWALVDLVNAREGYFRFAQFHGSLELCAAAVLICARSLRA